MQYKNFQQAFPFGGINNRILNEAVVSDLLRKPKTEWSQHYHNCWG